MDTEKPIDIVHLLCTLKQYWIKKSEEKLKHPNNSIEGSTETTKCNTGTERTHAKKNIPETPLTHWERMKRLMQESGREDRARKLGLLPPMPETNYSVLSTQNQIEKPIEFSMLGPSIVDGKIARFDLSPTGSDSVEIWDSERSCWRQSSGDGISPIDIIAEGKKVTQDIAESLTDDICEVIQESHF